VALEDLAEELLGTTRTAVDVRGVEQRDALVQGSADDGAGRVQPPKLLQPRPTTDTTRPELPRGR
jgi:hypothetical protein